MFVRMSFLLARHPREPSDKSELFSRERKADDMLLDAAASALSRSLWRTKRHNDARSREVTRDLEGGIPALRLCLRSGPEATLMVSDMRLEIAPILRACFLLHQRDILLEG